MREPFEKYLKQKRTVSMTQVVEYLPAKCKALSSNPDTAKKNGQTDFIQAISVEEVDFNIEQSSTLNTAKRPGINSQQIE
jgi:hypothetical protein